MAWQGLEEGGTPPQGPLPVSPQGPLPVTFIATAAASLSRPYAADAGTAAAEQPPRPAATAGAAPPAVSAPPPAPLPRLQCPKYVPDLGPHGRWHRSWQLCCECHRWAQACVPTCRSLDQSGSGRFTRLTRGARLGWSARQAPRGSRSEGASAGCAGRAGGCRQARRRGWPLLWRDLWWLAGAATCAAARLRTRLDHPISHTRTSLQSTSWARRPHQPVSPTPNFPCSFTTRVRRRGPQSCCARWRPVTGSPVASSPPAQSRRCCRRLSTACRGAATSGACQETWVVLRMWGKRLVRGVCAASCSLPVCLPWPQLLRSLTSD